MRSVWAIDIRAPAAEVWPWLVQLGEGRAGFYSYDRLENLAGLHITSADTILAEFQQLRTGDRVPWNGQPGEGMAVVMVEPPHALVLDIAISPFIGRRIDPAARTGVRFHASWTFVVQERSEVASRLIVRLRADYRPRLLVGAATRLVLESAHFLMERKMLMGIKQRAERRRPTSAPRVPA